MTGRDRPLGPTELKRLHREWRRRTEGRVALLLDDVQNPFNLGSIVRSAAALRVDHLYLSGHTPPPRGPKVAKTALGTERYLTWSRHDEPREAIAAARRAGFVIVAVELAPSAVPVHELEVRGDWCIAVGHEDRGVSAAVLAAADAVAFIPQLGRVASLNVAQAAAIALYEARRRQWSPAPPRPAGLGQEPSESDG